MLQDLIGQDYTVVDNNTRYMRTEEHDSLVIDKEKQVFYWNSRSIFGNAYTWLIRIKGYTKVEANRLLKDTNFFSVPVTQKVEKKEGIVPYVKLVDLFYERGKTHREYWHEKRGYTDKTIDAFKLGYTGEWYTIPIYVLGKFKNFQLRRQEPKKRVAYWYRDGGKHPFNFSILSMTDWVVVTEGPVDAIMLRQNNIPAVSQISGSGYWNDKWNGLLLKLKEIYICYDNDDAGITHSVEVAEKFGVKAKVYNFWDFCHGFDVTDFFIQGNSREDFLNLLKNDSKYYFEVGTGHDI